MKKKILMLVMALTVILSVFSVTPVMAADNAPGSETMNDVEEDNTQYFNDNKYTFEKGNNFLANAVCEMMVDIVSPDADLINANRIVMSASSNGSSVSISTLGNATSFNMASGFVSTFIGYMRGIAIVILVASFGVSLLQMALEGGGIQYDEVVIRKLVMFGVSVVGVVLAGRIVVQIANLGTGFVDLVARTANVNNNASSQLDTIVTSIQKQCELPEFKISTLGTYFGNLLKALGYYLNLIIPWLGSKISTLLVQVVSWGRIIEILAIVAFAPLGFIGQTGHSVIDRIMRYVRVVFSISIQGAIIVMALYLVDVLKMDMIGEMFVDSTIKMSVLWRCVMLDIVRFTICSKSRQIAQSVVG